MAQLERQEHNAGLENPLAQRKLPGVSVSANPRNRISRLQVLSSERSEASPWQVFDSTFVHKMFVWDRQGTYIDCQFPNPVHGHFFGGPTLRGKKVHEVLPEKAADIVHKGIARVLQQREPWKGEIEMHVGTRGVHSHIYFIPVGELVLGLVTDSLLPESGSVIPLRIATNHETVSGNFHILLSTKERAIVMEVKRGLSNRGIAQYLKTSERMVKFHLANIYCKLRLSSRYELIKWTPIGNSFCPLLNENPLQSASDAHPH